MDGNIREYSLLKTFERLCNICEKTNILQKKTATKKLETEKNNADRRCNSNHDS